MAYDFLFVLRVIWVSEELLTEQNQSMGLSCLPIVFVVWAGKTQHAEWVTQEVCDQVGFQLF